GLEFNRSSCSASVETLPHYLLAPVTAANDRYVKWIHFSRLALISRTSCGIYWEPGLALGRAVALMFFHRIPESFLVTARESSKPLLLTFMVISDILQ